MLAFRRNRRSIVAVLLLALWAGGMAGFPGRTARAAETDSRQVRAAQRKGAGLEKDRQWLKAIRHYEKALKEYPGDGRLRYGLRRSRIHFSIARRYHDRSFESKLLTKSKSAALDLFDDVLSQVRGSYVHAISSTSFVAHGTESLYMALANDNFAAKHLKGVDPQRIQRMRRILRDQYWNKPQANRLAARNTVAGVAETAQSVVGIPPAAVVMEYTFGGCNALDDYSSLLTPNRLEDLYGNIDGEFVGLGIEMKAEFGKGMLLVNILPDSPAQEGGMHRGEYITAINGRDCRNMTTDAASRLLRGRSGTTARLALTDGDGRTRTREFVRRAVTVKSITVAEIIDARNGIGYIQMNGFQKTTAAELDAALAKLNRQGMKTLVWDLRGNPGGLLTTAVEVLDRFLSSGTLVSTRGRTRDQNWSYSARQLETWNTPLVLLVDGDSASASEIVAGAIRDHHRGLIVGRQTFGKWSVQSIFPMNEKMGFRMTTAKFYSPNGHNLSKVGVKPDVVVKTAPKRPLRYRAPRTPEEWKDDTDLSKAVEIIRKRAARG
ncbi:MAG: S41 family peptidase [Planctomycetaceae bacterium]